MGTQPCAITVGHFDGVHLGHRALVALAREKAGAGGSVVALCFGRHPATTLRADQAPPPISDLAQRESALREAGVNRVAWLEPDGALLGLSPEAFVERVVTEHHPTAWVEGPDFRFGRGRAGGIDTLERLGASHGFEVAIAEPVHTLLLDRTDVRVSSSLIRTLIAAGRVADAAVCLGRPFAVRGRVVSGEQRGRTIGFPTANLDADGRILPADGVYGGSVTIDNIDHAAAISVGTNTTFGDGPRTFEAHILGIDTDLYGRVLEVRVERWLRDQATFTDTATLVAQIQRDTEQVAAYFRSGHLTPSGAAGG